MIQHWDTKESLAHCIVYRAMVESGTCIAVRSKEKDQQQWRRGQVLVRV